MISLRDHFQTLGISERSSLGDALASYKDLIRVWHPDRFAHDPRLRAKAEEHTSRLNVAMAEVKEFFKNPSAYHHRLEPDAEPSPSTPPSPAATPSLGKTLAVHRRRRLSLRQAARGLLLLYIGWWMSIEHPGSAGQLALGIVLFGYGLSTALTAATLLCFQRPLISVTNSSIRILGRPSIPFEELAASHLIVTTKGSLFTLRASSRYVKNTPIPLRLWLQATLLVRRNHFEARASSLDTHPALILDTLGLIAAQSAVKPHQPEAPSSWGYYASFFSIVTLVIPVTRIILGGPLSPSAILPYFMLFALLRLTSVVATIILAPTR